MNNYYAVRVGRKPGVYKDWAKCFINISGYKNARFKQFNTYEEAIEFVSPKISNTLLDDNLSLYQKEMHIYTDGSCINNGKKYARAGIGVYFGENDPRNVSEKFTDTPTNQRAELYAIIKAIRLIKDDEFKNKIIIHTDSMYSINCVTKWCKGWIKNGWKTKNKKNVKNANLIKQLYNLVKKNNIYLNHIRAHTGKIDVHSIGNDFADKLANKGAATNPFEYL